MKLTLQLISLSIAVVATFASGLLHGHLSQRWNEPMDIRTIPAQLSEVPTEFGEWHLHDSSELGEQVIKTLQCVDYLSRTYVNRKTGESVNVALLLGPSGPISVHTPEICYSSRDFEIRKKRERRDLATANGTNNQFWSVTLKSRGVDGETLNVCYGWNGGDRWIAPQQTRIYFAGKPFLYKIQLAATRPPHTGTNDADTCTSFLTEFLPEIDRFLITASPTNK